jgi:iron-sulfur cluster repair protein YtfE (RIC family)
MQKRKSTSKSRSSRSSVDAVSLLKNDHKEVRGLLKELVSAAEQGGSEAEELLQQIESEIQAHTTIEEEIFYPAFKDALESQEDEHIYFEALEEHHVVDMVMPEIKDTDSNSEEFAAKCKVLKDLIEHHAEEEEEEMLPKAQKLIDKDELRSLGERMMERKQEILGDMGTTEKAA